MNRIRILDKQVAELIAAGEVVERPASAVKELLENAIDASAGAVTLEIKNGGVSYIRVTDNGTGILREDVPRAFISHATSKVSTAQDLEGISTLGFRGEALASIAAVSKVELTTRTGDELAGTKIRVEGGKIVETDDAGCPQGTTIIVRQLFFNTPARMKFLKKDVSEGNAVTAVVQRIALSHPEVSIRYVRDGREELHTPGDNRLISVVHAVLGKEFAHSLYPVSYELEGIRVSGYTGKPVSSRPNRNMQYFFLNGRLVKTKTAMAALEEAYKNSVMTGKYPCCVLNLEMNPRLVDVNVHPAKIEVRFSNEKRVFSAVYYAVKTALSENDTRPGVSLPFAQKNDFEPDSAAAVLTQDKPSQAPVQLGINLAGAVRRAEREENTVGEEQDAVFDSLRTVYQPVNESAAGGSGSAEPRRETAAEHETERINERAPGQDERESAESAARDVLPAETGEQDSGYRIIGECFDTYVLVQRAQELILIDKHAAHERILFEKIKAGREETAQLLLTPEPITLAPAEYSAVIENRGLLKSAGFELDDFGGSAVLVRAAPLNLAGEDLPNLIAEIAGYLMKNKKDITPHRLDWIYESVACRAAIKGGDRSTQEEIRKLVKRILESGDIRYCPHGRPVAVTLTRKEIEKQFGRIV